MPISKYVQYSTRCDRCGALLEGYEASWAQTKRAYVKWLRTRGWHNVRSEWLCHECYPKQLGTEAA